MKTKLGAVYRDTVSGFIGKATGRTEYLESTPQVELEAETGPTGDKKSRWIEEGRLELGPPPKEHGFSS